MSRKACLPLIFIVCIAAISGCTAGNQSSGDALSADKYVAVEEYYLRDCTMIAGSYNLPPHIVPTMVFVYDGSLNGSNAADGSGWSNFRPENLDNYYPRINGSFKVLYGTSYYRDLKPGDTSAGLRVRGVYDLPYTLQSGFVLQGIDRNGTLSGSYNNMPITLHKGEKWTSPAFSEITDGGGTGLDGQRFSYTASFNTTWTIMNLGIFDKSNLTRYNNSLTATGYNIAGGADPAEK